MKSSKFLRVSTNGYVSPFIQRNKDSDFNDEIENKLIKIIAEKEHLSLQFHSRLSAEDQNPLINK